MDVGYKGEEKAEENETYRPAGKANLYWVCFKTPPEIQTWVRCIWLGRFLV
jgi:hypothetical protein